MTTFQRLKHEARKAEQRSDWRKAIALYREAMRFDERQHGTSELGLFNRIGDLHIRLGEVPQAVECYEQAADRYAEADLPTSAVALCNKILRVAPDRTDVFRRLGLLHAATGLLAEARAATLQYVDRMEEAGSLGGAIEAVQEFVNLTGDETIRVQVADLLAERAHPDQAQAQLRLASDAGLRNGLDMDALEQRIERLGAPELDESLATAVDTRSEPEESEVVRLGERVSAALAANVPHGPALEAGRPASANEDAVISSPAEDSIAEPLNRFRARVQPELDRAGPELHYDLGVAYLAMGLGSAALEELRRGIAAPGRLRAAQEKIGEIFRPAQADPEIVPGPESKQAEAEPDLRLPEVPAAVPADGEPGDELEAVSEAVPEVAPESPDPEPSSFEFEAGPAGPRDSESLNPDLQGLLFRARLAQHQIRLAEDSGRTDHRSHLDLGAAYSAMGLREEAIRELLEAAVGPRHVASRAAAIMLEISRHPETEWELALSVADRVRDLGQSGPVETVLHELAGRWGEDHPGSDRLAELLGWAVTTVPPTAEPDSSARPGAELESESRPVEPTNAEPPVVDSSSLEVLDQLLDQLEVEAVGIEVPDLDERSDSVRVRDAAERMLAEGREKEAVSHLYRELEKLEDAREIREATAVVDHLLELRPDDVVLHHQRAEFALTLDDRELLLSSYMSLAACLRRQNASGNARTVYARILEIDPEHPEARKAFEQLSFVPGEQRTGALDTDPPPGSAADLESNPDRRPSQMLEGRAEFDALLDDLRDPGEDGDVFKGDAEAHFELGIAFKQMGMWDEALAELERAVSGHEDPVRVWEVMAECLEGAGRTEEAFEILTTAESHQGNQASPCLGVLYRLALLLLERGDQDGAVQRLRRVVDTDASFRDAASRLSALSP
jgi:tetratricopeptide (TPR) repeat protein